MDTGRSEVARLRQHVEAELVEMQGGFAGFATTGKHDSIAHTYEVVGRYQEHLARSIGDEEATTDVCEASMRIVR